ncbi:MAG: Polysaccharide biosynthesis protein CapD [Parcubacteria group bacterium GW2011_GWA1_36_12]|nr:MAG: Polysaccharide biosynthesis protein CapD [Parcubacteria group bacterium GW2011_GWA1_36_12]
MKKSEKLSNRQIAKNINGKVVVVTGGTGSIGSEIVRQLLNFSPKQIRVYSRDETKHFFLQKELDEIKTKVDVRYLIGDIRDKERLSKALVGANIVFHAAALKHVPYCEYNPFEAIKTNVYGTQNLIDLSIDHDVDKVIAISTDKAVYPNTLMGITKLLMERMIVGAPSYTGDAKTKFCVVRFGNVINSRGSVIPTWIEQIKKGGPVTVTNKHMTRFFMSINEAVDLIFRAFSDMKGQEIFVLKMIEHNILELANKTINENANGKTIKIKFTGRRNREKIKEQLYTEEERDTMIDHKDYFIILPNKIIFSKLIGDNRFRFK